MCATCETYVERLLVFRYWQVMEYACDLNHYYKTGYGYDINYQLACHLLQDMIDKLDKAVDNYGSQNLRLQCFILRVCILLVYQSQMFKIWYAFENIAEIYRVTQKKVITKNRITSKIWFRLTQNFSYIRLSLCSRHLQSSSLYYKNSLFHWRSKNGLPGAAGTFGSGGQSSRWPSRIPPLGSLLLLLWLLPSGQG